MFKNAVAKSSHLLLLAILFAPVNRLHAQSSCVVPQAPSSTGTDPEPTGDPDAITGTDPEPTGEPDAITGTDPEPTGEPGGHGFMLQTFAPAAVIGLGLS